MNNTIAELALLLAGTAFVGVIARLLRQPMVLAYIVVGMIMSGLRLVPISTSPLYQTFGDLGVTFLLFLIGLEINVTALKRVGGTAAVLGVGQILLTFAGGSILGLLLGLSAVSSLYIALALTFSSTVIVVKLLSEKQDLNSLYGKLSLGMLLVQDVVAIIVLVVLAGFQPGQAVTIAPIILTVTEAILLFGFTYWLGRTIMPLLFHKIARSEELLFITSLAWVFILSAAVQRLGFSIEIGGFLAGLSLANSSTHFQIASRIRPLRDFFIALFFIVLGSTVVLGNMSHLATPITAFSLFVLIGNPVIVIIILGVMGYHRRTSFLTGVTVAQISEFSLVLATLGMKLGHITSDDVLVVTAVGVITISISSYIIMYAERLYQFVEPFVALFHRGHAPLEPVGKSPFDRPILLIGAHRIGRGIVHRLPKKKVVILDADPDVVAALRHEGFRTMFGDSTDTDLLAEMPFGRFSLIISTMPNVEDNLHLLAFITSKPNKRGRRVILRADVDADAQQLYAHGADYVIQPQLSSGQYIGHVISRGLSDRALETLRAHDQHLGHVTRYA